MDRSHLSSIFVADALERDELFAWEHDTRLATAAEELLAGIHSPRASKLTLHVQLEHPCYNIDCLESRNAPEHIMSTGTAESKFPKRALISAIWEAASLNPHITSLELPSLVPFPVSTFYRERFVKFLSQLRVVTITLLGLWKPETVYSGAAAYRNFTTTLGQRLLSPSKDLRRLFLESAAEGPMAIGLVSEEPGFLRLPIIPVQHWPLLEYLELSRCFICPELVDFIDRHNDSLREVVLKCVAQSGGAARYHWKDFFSELDRREIRLTKLRVDPWHVDESPAYDRSAYLFFTYAYVDDQYFMVEDDPDYALEADWEDTQVYTKLMKRIELNARGY